MEQHKKIQIIPADNWFLAHKLPGSRIDITMPVVSFVLVEYMEESRLGIMQEVLPMVTFGGKVTISESHIALHHISEFPRKVHSLYQDMEVVTPTKVS